MSVEGKGKRKALDALSRPVSDEGYGTIDGTNVRAFTPSGSQVVEKNGRPVGTRTPDLYRVKVAL